MQTWLLKTDPADYGWDHLLHDKKTLWDGVANFAALKHLREMQKGDLAIVYNTGAEKKAVGIAEVVAAGDAPTVKVIKKLAAPVTLAQIKAHPAFADSPLVKIGRLSVVPISAAQWRALLALAQTSL